jgi:hypothetical protein
MGSKQKPTEKASIYDSLRRQSDFDLEKTSLLESRMQAATARLDGKFHSMLDTVVVLMWSHNCEQMDKNGLEGRYGNVKE